MMVVPALMKRSIVRAQFTIMRNRLSEDFWPCLNQKDKMGGYYSCTLMLLTTIQSCGELLEGTAGFQIKRKPTPPGASKAENGEPTPIEASGEIDESKPLQVARSGERGMKFIRTYLGQVNERYAKLAGILQVIFRHRLAHDFQPGALTLNDGTRIGWELVKNAPTHRREHLHLTDGVGSGKVFHIVLEQFHDDLLQAINLFEQDVLASEARIQQVGIQIDRLYGFTTEAELLEKFRYVRKEEFDYLRDQLVISKENRCLAE